MLATSFPKVSAISSKCCCEPAPLVVLSLRCPELQHPMDRPGCFGQQSAAPKAVPAQTHGAKAKLREREGKKPPRCCLNSLGVHDIYWDDLFRLCSPREELLDPQLELLCPLKKSLLYNDPAFSFGSTKCILWWLSQGQAARFNPAVSLLVWEKGPDVTTMWWMAPSATTGSPDMGDGSAGTTAVGG